MGFQKIYKKYSFKNISGNMADDLITLSQDQIDELHIVALGIMDDIFSFCKENDINCFLCGGTALGAVRHHGFIPWDDDVDLNMPRADFNKFVPAFREKFNDKYWIHTPQDHPQFGMTICRVREKKTLLKTKEDLIDDSEAGIYVDIFIVENIPNNKILQRLQGCLCIVCKICLSCRRFYRDRKIMKKALKQDREVQNISRFRLILGFFCSFLSVEKWTRLTDKIFSLCKNNNSNQVSIPSGRWHYFGEIYDREKFCVTKPIVFEGRELPVSLGVLDYMKNLYGNDYMELPPAEEREEHVCWGIDLGSTS